MSIDLKLDENCKISYYHPKNYYKIYANNELVGDVFLLHPVTDSAIEANALSVGFEIDFSALAKISQNEIKFEKISKFPTTKLDFNFIIPNEKLYADIITIAKSIKSELNYKVSLLDIYQNANNTKSYTLHYDLNSLERNLTTEDIEKFHKEVIDTFKTNGIELKI